MSDTSKDRPRSPWPAVAVIGVAAGAACIALRCFQRAARARERKSPPVSEERVRAVMPAREPRALVYTNLRYAALLLGEALTLSLLILMNRKDRPLRLRRWAERVACCSPARDALFGGSLIALFTATTLPFSFLSGFVIERAFRLSNQRAASWLADAAKGFGVSLALGAPSIAGLYAIIRRMPERWWLWAGGAWSLLAVVLANLSPILIDPLFFRFTPLRDEELRRRLTALAERAGLPVIGVFEADFSRKTKKANAYLTGMANTRRIVLTDTLLAGYTSDEIAAVLAHELGHHHYGHIWRAIVLGTVGTLAGFMLADNTLRRAGAQAGYRGKGDVATLPALSLFLNILGLFAMPVGNTLSRAWERQCDRFALELTGDPQAFISAMRKLAVQNLADPAPPALIEAILYDHPAIRNRIVMALESEGRAGE